MATGHSAVLEGHVTRSRAGFTYTDETSFAEAVHRAEVERSACAVRAKKYAERFHWSAVVDASLEEIEALGALIEEALSLPPPPRWAPPGGTVHCSVRRVGVTFIGLLVATLPTEASAQEQPFVYSSPTGTDGGFPDISQAVTASPQAAFYPCSPIGNTGSTTHMALRVPIPPRTTLRIDAVHATVGAYNQLPLMWESNARLDVYAASPTDPRLPGALIGQFAAAGNTLDVFDVVGVEPQLHSTEKQRRRYVPSVRPRVDNPTSQTDFFFVSLRGGASSLTAVPQVLCTPSPVAPAVALRCDTGASNWCFLACNSDPECVTNIIDFECFGIPVALRNQWIRVEALAPTNCEPHMEVVGAATPLLTCAADNDCADAGSAPYCRQGVCCAFDCFGGDAGSGFSCNRPGAYGLCAGAAPCDAGFQFNSMGQGATGTQCVACAAGTYALPLVGLCAPCPSGQASGPMSGACVSCPPAQTSPNDCKRNVCGGAKLLEVPDDTEVPLPTMSSCLVLTCADGGAVATPTHAMCNDNNVCTIDTCSAQGSCASTTIAGCDAGVDAGSPEGGVDAGASDAGVSDAGSDAGLSDSGVSDAGLSDAGVSDAGLSDAGVSDAGVSDAGVSDAGVSDAGVSDAGVSDAGVSDAGLSDAGVSDAGSDADDAGVLDAGNTSGPDAGIKTDGGVLTGDPAADGGVDAGVPGDDPKLDGPRGCGCGSSGAELALLGALFFGRRRRRLPDGRGFPREQRWR